MNGNRLSPLCNESVIIVDRVEQSRQNWSLSLPYRPEEFMERATGAPAPLCGSISSPVNSRPVPSCAPPRQPAAN